MLTKDFVHLNVHTEFSLKKSLIKIPKLIGKVKDSGMKAVAVSDDSNMFGTIKHYKKSMESGVKPIIAMKINLQMGDFANLQMGKVIIIAENNIGYRNLTQMISDAYESGNHETGREPIITFDQLKDFSEGVIVLSGAREGSIGKSLIKGDLELARIQAEAMKSVFADNFFLELQRTGHHHDDKQVHAAVRLAVQADIPVVATNGALFLEHKDHRNHQLRTAIADKNSFSQVMDNNVHGHMPDQYLKTPEEMAEIFHDIPSAIENTVAIAKKCNVEITLGQAVLPTFPDAEKLGVSEANYLVRESYKGLEERLDRLYGIGTAAYKEKRKEYYDRIKVELEIVIDMGFPGYFLIVSDFIQWSKDNSIPVGPGRGSGAGSLIAYSLKITDLDPLKYGLLFERFLNPERVSMPDFDIDFCMDRREEVIKYNADKYGHNAVSQIITYGTMAAKMVVKDVSRALGYPFAVSARISGLIPNIPGIKLSEAIEGNPDFQLAIQTDSEVKKIIEHSLSLEGLVRQTGKHAGGVVISKGPLTGFTPTYNEFDKQGEVINKVSQFDKNDVEDAGLVKFDFLGLKTLTIMQNAIDYINSDRKIEGLPPIDINEIDLNDASVYEMYQKGEVSAVFQVESNGMKELIIRMKPDCFEDLIALVALYRPGPLESGMVDNFINRKHGREEVSYPDSTYQHESLKEVLEETYGIIVYQEQVMKIAQILSGYTLGEADMLRRAMGKKKPEEMAKQSTMFKQGAINNGIDGELGIKIFELVEKFAGYGFNKSHSAAYALVSFQTAWLKKYYPSQFMAAVLSADMNNTDKIVAYVNECRSMGISVLPPDLNISGRNFTPKSNTEIVFGIGAIKNIGDSAVDKILEQREKDGPYKNIFDFCTRVRPNKRVLEAGVSSGLFDNVGPDRHIMHETIPKAIEVGRYLSVKQAENASQLGMFGELSEDQSIIKYEDAKEWGALKLLSGERKSLGMYITGHPLHFYNKEISPIVSGTFKSLVGTNMEEGNSDKGESGSNPEEMKQKWENKKVTIAGIIMDMEIKSNKKGQSAYLKIDDDSRQVDAVIFNKVYHDSQHLLESDKTLVFDGTLRMDNRSKKVRFIIDSVRSVDMVRERSAENIGVTIDLKKFNQSGQREKLAEILKKSTEGYASVVASFSRLDDGEMETKTLGNYRIKITDELISDLRGLFGDENVNIKYKEKDQEGKYITPKLNKEDKEKLIAEGQRTFEERSLKMAELFKVAEVEMGYSM